MQREITDGTLDGDPPGSNYGKILRSLLGTSEHIEEGTKNVYLMDI